MQIKPTIEMLKDLKKYAEQQSNSRLADCAIFAIEELQRIAGENDERA